MASPQELLEALSRAHHLAKALPSGDGQLDEALATAVELHASSGWLVIRVDEDGFRVNQEFVGPAVGEVEGFKNALSTAGITEVRLQDPIPEGDLEDFLRRLDPGVVAPGESGLVRFRGLEGALGLSFKATPKAAVGMAGSIQSLFGTEDEGAEEPDSTDSEPYVWAEEEGSEPSEVGILLAAYFSATGDERVQAGEAIVAASGRLVEARDLGSVADLVEGLCEGSGMGRKDPEALVLARRLTSSGVASQLVGRLGSSRDEEERSRLIEVSVGLGREMALAVSDALGEARDRFQRRAFMDAMVAQGEVAREMAEKMVEDPRWYVVRNGVSLLGELGGGTVVSHLTSTLANPDARVRRETVVALAKLGGDDAAALLLGMLGDAEADIRAKACTAVGVLRVDKALRPLMTLLSEDDDHEVQIQSLHALGQIGDPGAVPLIEKKAVNRLFSRPPKDIRMAAYRALAGIGTPHAMGLIQKATKDSDKAIRKLAQGLIE